MGNRIVSRLRIGACLLGLFSFVFATAQTPTADDDGLPIAVIIQAIKPVCTSVVASPATTVIGRAYSVTATCSKTPTAYIWRVNGVVVSGASAATVSLTAPATAGSTIVSVTALRGSIQSAPIQTTVNTVASVASFSVLRSSTQLGGIISFTVNPVSGNVSSLVVTNAATNAVLCSSGVGVTACNWLTNAVGVTNARADLTLSNGLTDTFYTSVAVTAAPAANAANAPIPTATAAIGTTPGSFDVSESGSASYSIPIQAAPGAGGMQPSLAMSYSSQGGNGHMGVGWNLQGLSAVTRCPKTYAQDGVKESINYDGDATNDQYCLDGQRLIVVAASQQLRDTVSCIDGTKKNELVTITE